MSLPDIEVALQHCLICNTGTGQEKPTTYSLCKKKKRERARKAALVPFTFGTRDTTVRHLATVVKFHLLLWWEQAVSVSCYQWEMKENKLYATLESCKILDDSRYYQTNQTALWTHYQPETGLDFKSSCPSYHNSGSHNWSHSAGNPPQKG